MDDPRLSERARGLVLDDDDDVFYSPVSLYEMVFKAGRGRAPSEAMRLPEAVHASGFEMLGLTSLHLVHAARLDWDHGDPWDTILLAQVALENVALLSADEVFDAQTEQRLW